MQTPAHHDGQTRLIEQALQGDDQAWRDLIEPYRARLRNMLMLRMHGRLTERVDPSDIIQEASIDAARRLPEYVSTQEVPFYLWLRQLTIQQLSKCFRTHLGTQARDLRREVSIGYDHSAIGLSSAEAIADLLVDDINTPSQLAVREENSRQLREAMTQLDPIDREVLALRHFEQLTNQEVAELLGLDKSAASKRYARALRRLLKVLHDIGFKSL